MIISYLEDVVSAFFRVISNSQLVANLKSLGHCDPASCVKGGTDGIYRRIHSSWSSKNKSVPRNGAGRNEHVVYVYNGSCSPIHSWLILIAVSRQISASSR